MKYFLKLIIIFCIWQTGYAESAGDTLTALLKSIRTMQANFTQSIQDNKGRIIQDSRGSMALQRPGKFRWETKSPNKQLVIANNKRLWIYDVDLEQVIIRALAQQAGQTPALLLSDTNLSFETDFNISLENKSTANLQWFLLKSKDKNSMFEFIRMAFAGNQIQEMQLQDHLGHVTVIKFQGVKLNTELAATLFNFKPPKNVDVIDETKH